MNNINKNKNYLDPNKNKKVIVFSPINGVIKDNNVLTDIMFAEEMLGDSVAVSPISGLIVAPFDGSVISLFPSNHAISLRNKDGIEILIHIGIDTVYLEGTHFKPFVKKGDNVKQGQKLIKFNIKAINDKGYNSDTIIIFINHDKYKYEKNSRIGSTINKHNKIFEVYLDK